MIQLKNNFSEIFNFKNLAVYNTLVYIKYNHLNIIIFMHFLNTYVILLMYNFKFKQGGQEGQSMLKS